MSIFANLKVKTLNHIKLLVERAFPKASFLRQVSILAGGTFIAQGLTVIFTPFLSRIYSPADFGVMAAFVSVTSILTVLSGFRYHLAITLPKSERYARSLVLLSIFFQSIFVISSLCVFLFCGKPLLHRLSLDKLIPYRGVIPLAVGAIGIYNTLTRWAIREKAFRIIAQTKISQCLTGTLAKLFFGLIGVRPLGLIIGSIMASAGGITTLFRFLLKADFFRQQIRLEDIRRVLLRYRRFPFYEIWSELLNTLGTQMIPLLFISFFTSELAGLFSMAQMLLLIPSVFIGQAIAQVFLQRASVAYYQGNLKELAMSIYVKLVRLGLFPIILISVFSPVIFSVALGPKWYNAGIFALTLSPSVAIGFAYSPMSVLFSVLSLQKAELYFEIILLTIRLFAFWLGSKLGGPILATTLFSAAYLLVTLGRIAYVLVSAGVSFKLHILITFRLLIETTALITPPLIFRLIKAPLPLIISSLILSTTIFIYITIRAQDPNPSDYDRANS